MTTIIRLDLTVLDELDDDVAAAISPEDFLATVAALTALKEAREDAWDHSAHRRAWEA